MIQADSVAKIFPGGAGHALRDVSFAVAPGAVYTLLGPSGCGKTTLLRSIAGLETPDDGRISIGGLEVFSGRRRVNLRPNQRRIGMVFQSYAIWPHMTVAQNVAYPLEGTGRGRAEIDERVGAVLELVGLSGLADRPAPNLSGGQQQRVAFARALANHPEVLLLDEPLSNLDAKLREQMREEIIRLQGSLGQTILYVTHDQEEALAMSQRIALMRGGEIIEEGEPVALFERPGHPFTASFLGAANFVPCTAPSGVRVGDTVEVETVFGRFNALVRKGEPGQSDLFFRPHQASLTNASPQRRDVGEAYVVHATFLGEKTSLSLRKTGQLIRVHVARVDRPLAQGDVVNFEVDRTFSLAFIGDALPGRAGAEAPIRTAMVAG